MDQEIVMLYISTGLKVLSSRVLLVLGMLLTFALFAWTMAAPDPYRLGAACAFAVLVWWPTSRMDRALKGERSVVSPRSEQ